MAILLVIVVGIIAIVSYSGPGNVLGISAHQAPAAGRVRPVAAVRTTGSRAPAHFRTLPPGAKLPPMRVPQTSQKSSLAESWPSGHLTIAYPSL